MGTMSRFDRFSSYTVLTVMLGLFLMIPAAGVMALYIAFFPSAQAAEATLRTIEDGIENGFTSSVKDRDRQGVLFMDGDRVALTIRGPVAKRWRRFRAELGNAFIDRPVVEVHHRLDRRLGKIYRFKGGIIFEGKSQLFYMSWPLFYALQGSGAQLTPIGGNQPEPPK